MCQQSVNVEDVLRAFVALESNPDKDRRCHNCNNKGCCTRKTEIESFGDEILLNFKRFKFDSSTRTITKNDMPIILRQFMWLPSRGEKSLYELTYVNIHSGRHHKAGHYTAYERGVHNIYFFRDDRSVAKVSVNVVLNRTDAYSVAYRKIRPPSLTKSHFEAPSPFSPHLSPRLPIISHWQSNSLPCSTSPRSAQPLESPHSDSGIRNISPRQQDSLLCSPLTSHIPILPQSPQISPPCSPPPRSSPAPFHRRESPSVFTSTSPLSNMESVLEVSSAEDENTEVNVRDCASHEHIKKIQKRKSQPSVLPSVFSHSKKSKITQQGTIKCTSCHSSKPKHDFHENVLLCKSCTGRYKCPHCLQPFARRGRLNSHIEKNHSASPTTQRDTPLNSANGGNQFSENQRSQRGVDPTRKCKLCGILFTHTSKSLACTCQEFREVTDPESVLMQTFDDGNPISLAELLALPKDRRGLLSIKRKTNSSIVQVVFTSTDAFEQWMRDMEVNLCVNFELCADSMYRCKRHGQSRRNYKKVATKRVTHRKSVHFSSIICTLLLFYYIYD